MPNFSTVYPLADAGGLLVPLALAWGSLISFWLRHGMMAGLGVAFIGGGA